VHLWIPEYTFVLIAHAPYQHPGLCAGQGGRAHLGAGAAVRGSRCAAPGLSPCPRVVAVGMGLAPCPPAVAVGTGLAGGLPVQGQGRLPCRTCPAPKPTQAPLPRQALSSATQGFAAGHRSAAFHAPAVGLLTSLMLLAPRSSDAVVRFPSFHICKTQLPPPTAPAPRQGAAAAAKPHTWLSRRNLAWFYPLAGARITPVCRFRALVVAIVH